MSLHAYIYALSASGALKIYIRTCTCACNILHVHICTAHNIYLHVHMCPNICTYTCACNVMCVYLCMYVLEPCKYAGLRSRWWFCHNEIETRPPSSPPPLHISSWDGWFYSWMIAAALALWWGDLFDVQILCQRTIFAVVTIVAIGVCLS